MNEYIIYPLLVLLGYFLGYGICKYQNKKIMEENKMNWKKIGIYSILVLMTVGAVFAVEAIGGYRLFDAITHFNVQEGVEAQYWDGDSWESIATNGNAFDLPTQNIKAGETKELSIQYRNTATSGVLGIEVSQAEVEDLTNDMECVTAGIEYTENANEYFFKAPSDSVWRQFKLKVTADGAISVGEITQSDKMYRDNSQVSYASVCGV